MRCLDPKTQDRIVAAVEPLVETGHGDMRRVEDRPGELAIRVGDWRVFYRPGKETVEGETVEVYNFLRVRPRGSERAAEALQVQADANAKALELLVEMATWET